MGKWWVFLLTHHFLKKDLKKPKQWRVLLFYRWNPPVNESLTKAKRPQQTKQTRRLWLPLVFTLLFCYLFRVKSYLVEKEEDQPHLFRTPEVWKPESRASLLRFLLDILYYYYYILFIGRHLGSQCQELWSGWSWVRWPPRATTTARTAWTIPTQDR